MDYSKLQQLSSALQELTCHMESHVAEMTFSPLPQPIRVGTRFSDPRQMQGCVHLVGLVSHQNGMPA